jgi:hypothetical protein
MQTQIVSTHQESKLLRYALRGNGIFSLITGAAFVLDAKPLADLMGLPWSLALTIIGAVVLPFALLLLWVTAQKEIHPTLAKTIIALDAAWVIISLLLLLTNWLNLSTAGNWIVAVLAEVVLTFAILQTVGLRRLQR